jgi:type I restriction enzyme M protein
MNTSSIVQKLWNYCNVLRDDGMLYGDYVEAAPAHPCARGIRTSLFNTLTYLLFLKMADDRTRQLLLRCSTSRHPWRSQAPCNQKSPVPEQYSWPSPEVLYRAYKGKEYKAYLTKSGTIRYGNTTYHSPTGAPPRL